MAHCPELWIAFTIIELVRREKNPTAYTVSMVLVLCITGAFLLIAHPITASQAVLLMGAILSDTVALTGPTTTTQDQEAMAVLREIAGIDYDQFVTGLLRAKTDITGQSTSVLLNRDAKNYRIHDVPLLLSQIEVRDMTDITPLLPALLQEMDKTCKDSSLDMVILMVTDITNRNSVLLFSDSSLTGSLQVSLPGMTSRKKEILPWLTDRFASYKR